MRSAGKLYPRRSGQPPAGELQDKGLCGWRGRSVGTGRLRAASSVPSPGPGPLRMSRGRVTSILTQGHLSLRPASLGGQCGELATLQGLPAPCSHHPGCGLGPGVSQAPWARTEQRRWPPRETESCGPGLPRLGMTLPSTARLSPGKAPGDSSWRLAVPPPGPCFRSSSALPNSCPCSSRERWPPSTAGEVTPALMRRCSEFQNLLA